MQHERDPIKKTNFELKICISENNFLKIDWKTKINENKRLDQGPLFEMG